MSLVHLVAALMLAPDGDQPLPPPPPPPTPKYETSPAPSADAPPPPSAPDGDPLAPLPTGDWAVPKPEAAPSEELPRVAMPRVLDPACPTRGIVEQAEVRDPDGTLRRSRVTLCARDSSDATYRGLLTSARASIRSSDRLTPESRDRLLEKIDKELATLPPPPPLKRPNFNRPDEAPPVGR